MKMTMKTMSKRELWLYVSSEWVLQQRAMQHAFGTFASGFADLCRIVGSAGSVDFARIVGSAGSVGCGDERRRGGDRRVLVRNHGEAAGFHLPRVDRLGLAWSACNPVCVVGTCPRRTWGSRGPWKKKTAVRIDLFS